MTTVQSMIPYGFSFSPDQQATQIIRMALILMAGICILGGLCRLIWGHNSSFVQALSAGISIFFLCLLLILLFRFAPELGSRLPPLPFVTIGADSFAIHNISALSSDEFLSCALRLYLLAVLMNLASALFPTDGKFTSWYFIRLAVVCCVLAVYTGLCLLCERYAPEFFGQWSGIILIGLWALIGLLGLTKWMLALIAAVVNPVLGLLFAFFFSSAVGKHFTKAIATSLLIIGALFAMNQAGFHGMAFSQLSATGYGLSLILVSAVLYLFGKF